MKWIEKVDEFVLNLVASTLLLLAVLLIAGAAIILLVILYNGAHYIAGWYGVTAAVLLHGLMFWYVSRR